MDNVRWKELIVAAKPEIRRSAADMLIRGILAGVFLGFANIARFLCEFPGPAADRRIDSLPGGFVMLVLLGFELAPATLR
jgi:formate/nitrite transporter FocA (FNT family)